MRDIAPWPGGHGHLSSRPFRPPGRLELLRTALPSLPTELPLDFDWRSVGGVSYVTADVNQHVPRYCGSCWIHGTVAALNDRIKIMRGARFPDVMLSRQVLMNCVPGINASAPPGCGGGDAWQIHEYLERTSVPDETCQPYEAQNGQCDPLGQCRNCVPTGLSGLPAGVTPGCFAVPSYVGYGVSEYGSVQGEDAMMHEILARGPIVCSFAADTRFVFNYSEVAARNHGVYVDQREFAEEEVDHDVAVAGWGVTGAGVRYWIVRNSYWGEGGWFRLRRGVNQQRIESDCSWAVPRIDQLEASVTTHALGDYVHGVSVAPLAANALSSRAAPPSHRADEAGGRSNRADDEEGEAPPAHEEEPRRDGEKSAGEQGRKVAGDGKASHAAPTAGGGRGHDGEGRPGAHLEPPPPASADAASADASAPPGADDGRGSERDYESDAERADERSGDLSSPAFRMPLVTALLLAGLALTTASALSVSLLTGAPKTPEALSTPFAVTADDDNYQAPPYEAFRPDDWRPAGSPPPMRWKVPL